MLHDSDLKTFITVFGASGAPSIAPAPPREVLLQDEGLYPSEVWRLVCSLQIAAVLGDAPQAAAAAAQVILDDVRDIRCAPLSDQHAWSRAVRWAMAQPALADPTATEVPLGRERERIVGAACWRLRKRGYRVEVGAYGPQISADSRRGIVRSAETLIGILGGLETVNQVLRILRQANSYHDGMWLFGEVGLHLYANKHPMIPVGWLMSLALRNLGSPGGARKPEVAWKSLVELAIDFAAAHDCQRYNQFADMTNLHPAQIHRTLLNSTLWRELFTLPQTPSKALRQILDALSTVLTQEDEELLGFVPRAFVREMLQLLDWSADDRVTVHPRALIEGALPLLRRLTGGAAETVNADYGDPLAAPGRTQDSTLLFACGRDRAITLPRAFLAAAGCEFIFRLIWSKLEPDRASKVVGDTLERAIEAACRDKASSVLANRSYQVEKRRYEIDVATREEDRIVLIEVKGKMLTSRSRSGDMFSFFRDYSDGFLRLLAQLVRHEIHLRQGRTPLTEAGETVDDLRPVKVAVSPLSYGPVSDKVLSGNLIRSFVASKLSLVTPDEANQIIIDRLNKRTEAILKAMAHVAPKKDGLVDLFSYTFDIFWLDIGQLLYIINRANNVWDAFGPLKHITFSSRDFWTELASADRGGLTANKWRQVA